MKNLGFMSQAAVEIMACGNEYIYIEYSEGCLLDNFISWDSHAEQYVLCLAHVLTTWTSCYEVSAGDETEIFNMWNKMFKM